MSMQDDFKAQTQASKQKRRQNREASMQLLRSRNVAFTEHNGGSHLIVEGAWDFYPGTGLYVQRGRERRSGRGVFGLLQCLHAHKFSPTDQEQKGNEQEAQQ